MKKHKLTVEVESKEIAANLSSIAASLGFVASRGPGAGKRGAIGQLIQAVADGQLTVTRIKMSLPGPTEQELDELRAYKLKARTRVRSAVGRGHLQPARDFTCNCGKPALEYHHSDYSKPFDIQAVCRECHGKLHTKKEG